MQTLNTDQNYLMACLLRNSCSSDVFRLALEIVNNAYHLCVDLLQLSGAQCSPKFVVTYYQTTQHHIVRLSGYV